MSKLKIVKHALETNPKLVIIGVDEKNYLPNRNGFFSHTVDYWVAPKRGLYTAPELQDFMTNLIPNLTPTSVDSFSYSQFGDLRFGKLYFDERIGEEKIVTKRIITLDEDELLKVMEEYKLKAQSSPWLKETITKDVFSGKQTIEKEVTNDYLRRIWVSPFPNEAIARDILQGKLDSEFSISADDLRRYKLSPLRRLLRIR